MLGTAPNARNNSPFSPTFYTDSPVKVHLDRLRRRRSRGPWQLRGRIQEDQGTARIHGATNFSCANPGATVGDTYTLKMTVCDAIPSCVQSTSIQVDMTGAGIAAALCPPPPEEVDCDSCQCKSSGGGEGAGFGSPSGGGGFCGGRGTGPDTFWYYKAGGVGRTGHPGAGTWPHGRYWSHTYAETILPHATDPDTVYLVTETAVYRTFTDTDADDIYDQISPASEYRTLEKIGGGGGRVRTITEVGVDLVTRTWTYTWVGDDLT